jgi:hypothetical protein
MGTSPPEPIAIRSFYPVGADEKDDVASSAAGAISGTQDKQENGRGSIMIHGVLIEDA